MTALQERDVYVAIADPTRRKIVHLLAHSNELPLYELTNHFEMGRTAVSKHLKILDDANLVTKRRIGRETRYQFNPEPLLEIKNWITYYEQFWTERTNILRDLLGE